MLDQPSERLRWAREQAGFPSAAALARAMNVPEVTYRAHEKGPRAVGGRGLSETTARSYARHLGVSWAWLMTGIGEPFDDPGKGRRRADAPGPAQERATTSDSAPAVPAPASLPRDVPLRGIAVGGDDGSFEFNGEIVDYVLRPPGIARARDVFAVYVVGDSMAPRYEEGDLVFVHPGRPPHSGCDVLVELLEEETEPGPCLIKRLVPAHAQPDSAATVQPAAQRLRVPPCPGATPLSHSDGRRATGRLM